MLFVDPIFFVFFLVTASVYWLMTSHDWRKQVLLDLDLTPLRASKRSEDSTKGYIGKKTKPDAN